MAAGYSYSYSYSYAFTTCLLATATAYLLLLLVLVHVPPTSPLRAWLLPVLVLPTLFVSRMAVYATPVMPFNFVLGVGYGPRLALEMFDLLCISKAAYPGDSGSSSSAGDEKDGEKTADRLPWTARVGRAVSWLCEVSSPDRGREGYTEVSRETARRTSRRQFLVFRAARLVLGYLALDFISSQSLEGADVKFGPGKEQILSRIVAGDFSGEDFGETLGSIVGYAASGYLYLLTISDLVSLLAVGLGFSRAQDWPPFFGPLTRLYSIRNLWGVVWHRQLRVLLVDYSYFITHSILRLPLADSVAPESKILLLLIRYVRIQMAFLVSGLLHLPIDTMQGVPLRESAIVTFFTVQALGILIEDAVCGIYRWITTGSFSRHEARSLEKKEPALWMKLVGFLWLICWAMWCMPPWIFPVIRRPPMSVVPYSFFARAEA
ncbi:hypothetical protein H112_02780 [Trichophyton rubrum D6]|nr:hypothetical protein H100_02787 [Trichophyton rubrum MR850]EZF43740.1 hypothetical protein H102_02779 [Trichophyton rubrum CBS 100081]EZF54333.1 hypothetical protein H103_02791 [Trichophyton rubrum CBS 288.86]EZF65024.1 hypothetical protein H104_02770 [Trichophyton rubrum CBS 289.86]EZF75601.1 hypothetical protein H105_02796 [Trichophyton soudanense CBS 452.61]EZF86370.1 hypothetical protein H110_02789 [Trichophyton rubrum MR1448]EZG18638.1 hypothetical protein H107_02865 [Trichophyton rub